MSGLVKDNIFGSSGVVLEAAGGLSWQPVVVAPTGATFTVTVVSTGSGNRYFIDGVQQLTLNLSEGFTYKFDQADSSNSGHPLRFSTTSGGTHSGGSEYTTGVTTNGTPGNAGAYTQIAVAVGAPLLYYYCTNHNYMGGTANTVSASVSVSAGKGFFVNTTAGAITIELPSSAEAGDQIILIDYARTWGTNAITIDSNGLNFQGAGDSYTVDYDTAGQSLNLVYSGATIGWTPSSDIVNALEPVAPIVKKAIFAYGQESGGVVSTANLISDQGVIGSNVTGVGTARYSPVGTGYGGDKGLFAYGNNSGALSTKNLVNNSGVVGANVTGVGTTRQYSAAAKYGVGKAIVLYGSDTNGNALNISNLISDQGVIGSNVSGVGTARWNGSGTTYGGDKAVYAFGYLGGGNSGERNTKNLINNQGVVAADASGVGATKRDVTAAPYGVGLALFAFGSDSGTKLNTRNLVNSSGVISADSTGAGTVRNAGAMVGYGGDKAIHCFGIINGNFLTAISNLVSNTGVIATDTSAVANAKERAVGSTYGF